MHDLGFINVLVAEEDEIKGMMLQRILTGWKANVTVAHSGAEAISKANSTDFDLILTDLKMTDMDGMEVVQQIKKTASNSSPIIAVAATVSYTIPDLKTAGVNQYLNRSYTTEDLFDAIDHNMYQNLKLVG
jgi:CheY-like chemotaxis protein